MSTADDTPRHPRPGRKEAKLALNEILARYGIPDPNKEELPKGKTLALVARKPKRRDHGLVSLKTSTGPAEKPLSQDRPALERRSGLNLGLSSHTDKAQVAKQPSRGPTPVDANSTLTSRLDTGNSVFHFLIRIAECTTQLHCQVTAENAIDARKKVAGLPNLIECREISTGELAELLRMENRG
jgi:hypothetical protein